MQKFPSDGEARQLILEMGRRMYAKNFVAANDGNISCKVAGDMLWTTSTGVSKGFMTEDMLVKMRLDGSVVEAGVRPPSSEVKMHLRVYRENPAVTGVTHAHPPASTSFAVAGIALDQAVYAETVVNLGVVPCVHYETPGSQGLPDAIAPYCKDYNAVLLANHGALTWGRSLTEAYFRLEALEHYAMILLYTQRLMGKAKVLSCDQVEQLRAVREQLGITGRLPTGAATPQNLEDIVTNGG